MLIRCSFSLRQCVQRVDLPLYHSDGDITLSWVVSQYCVAGS